MTHGPEKSDLSTVAMKLTNKIGQPEAESVERRGRAEGNMEGQHIRRTQSRESLTVYEKQRSKRRRNGSQLCFTM
jgi:RNA-directed DNA polymerase